MAGSAARPEQTALARTGEGGTDLGLRPGQTAAAASLAQLDFNEAPHVGILGDTGCGKTTATLRLIQLYLQKSPGSVLVVDDKELTTKFPGQQRRDVQDLRDHPIDWQQGRVIVFRGDVAHGVRVDLEEVAELAWVRAGRGRRTLCVWDELIAGREKLTKNAQWRRGVEWLPKSFTMGRSVGIANLWGAQSPQDVPKDCFEQSSSILTFRLAGLGLQRLRERDYLTGGADLVVPKLPGPPMPPNERGEFVLLMRGKQWDRYRYKFDARGA